MKALLRLIRRVGIGTLICLVLLFDLVLLRIWDPVPVEAVRLRTFDFFQLLRPREVTQRPVVIVDIDEKSLKAHGQWPWPRTLVADLVTRINQGGAVAVAFDVVFAEPDRSSPEIAADAFRGLDDETRAKLRGLPSNDQVLAEAFRASRVVVGQSGLDGTAAAPPATPDGEPMPQTGFAALGTDPSPYLVTFPHLLRNVPALEEAAAGRGLFSLRPERDGVVRRVPMLMLAEETIVPSLTLELLRVATGADTLMTEANAAGVQRVAVAGFGIPTDPQGRVWVHFSPHDPGRFVSAADVLEGRVPPERLQGKLVLVGTSAVGLLDLKTTPVDPAMPGVEVHAQVLEGVLTKEVLTASSYATLAEIVIAVLLGLAMVAFAPHIGAWALFCLGGAVAASLVAMSWYYYAEKHLLIDLTFPLGSSLMVYGTLVFTNYLRAQTERRQIRSAFKQYLSPALVEQLAQSPDKLVLGGERRDMTVMFSDVRGFTAISELYKDDPQGLTTLMNRLLTPLTNAIIGRRGTIDKYMGDAIMAFWNAPLHDPDHAANACEAALQMLERLDELNRGRRAEAEAAGQPFLPMNVGIGLNAGPCVVGNMGSDLHFNYSVLGDTVNLASRLEGQSKTYGRQVILGANVARAVEARFAVLEIDLLKVKGKSEPEYVYTLLGRGDALSTDGFRTLIGANAAMLAAYRGGDWKGALEALLLCREAGKAFGLDDLYALYVTRVRTLMEAPPAADWNGVFVAETK